jgi:hypothetical protein
MAILSRDSQVGVPKFHQQGLLRLWGRITSCANLRSQCNLKKSCNPHRELSNSMSHVICMQGNQVDSRLLLVGSQTANLTHGLSFGHNLCFRCPNEQCEPILDIYTSIAFQWYKELLEARSFDSYNRVLKIRESFRDSNSQHGNMGVHLGVWGFMPSHSLHSQEHVKCSRVFLLARNLATPCLGHKPKARVVTIYMIQFWVTCIIKWFSILMVARKPILDTCFMAIGIWVCVYFFSIYIYIYIYI